MAGIPPGYPLGTGYPPNVGMPGAPIPGTMYYVQTSALGVPMMAPGYYAMPSSGLATPGVPSVGYYPAPGMMPVAPMAGAAVGAPGYPSMLSSVATAPISHPSPSVPLNPPVQPKANPVEAMFGKKSTTAPPPASTNASSSSPSPSIGSLLTPSLSPSAPTSSSSTRFPAIPTLQPTPSAPHITPTIPLGSPASFAPPLSAISDPLADDEFGEFTTAVPASPPSASSTVFPPVPATSSTAPSQSSSLATSNAPNRHTTNSHSADYTPPAVAASERPPPVIQSEYSADSLTVMPPSSTSSRDSDVSSTGILGNFSPLAADESFREISLSDSTSQVSSLHSSVASVSTMSTPSLPAVDIPASSAMSTSALSTSSGMAASPPKRLAWLNDSQIANLIGGEQIVQPKKSIGALLNATAPRAQSTPPQQPTATQPAATNESADSRKSRRAFDWSKVSDISSLLSNVSAAQEETKQLSTAATEAAAEDDFGEFVAGDSGASATATVTPPSAAPPATGFPHLGVGPVPTGVALAMGPRGGLPSLQPLPSVPLAAEKPHVPSSGGLSGLPQSVGALPLSSVPISPSPVPIPPSPVPIPSSLPLPPTASLVAMATPLSAGFEKPLQPLQPSNATKAATDDDEWTAFNAAPPLNTTSAAVAVSTPLHTTAASANVSLPPPVATPPLPVATPPSSGTPLPLVDTPSAAAALSTTAVTATLKPSLSTNALSLSSSGLPGNAAPATVAQGDEDEWGDFAAHTEVSTPPTVTAVTASLPKAPSSTTLTAPAATGGLDFSLLAGLGLPPLPTVTTVTPQSTAEPRAAPVSVKPVEDTKPTADSAVGSLHTAVSLSAATTATPETNGTTEEAEEEEWTSFEAPTQPATQVSTLSTPEAPTKAGPAAAEPTEQVVAKVLQSIFAELESSDKFVSKLLLTREPVRTATLAAAKVKQYMAALKRIGEVLFRVRSTVNTKMSTVFEVCTQSDKVAQAWDRVVAKWKTLCPAEEWNTATTAVANGNAAADGAVCRVCFQPIDKLAGDQAAWQGSEFHVTCANWWANRISITPP